MSTARSRDVAPAGPGPHGVGRRLSAFGVAVVLLAGTAALSQWPTTMGDGTSGIRLSWRLEPLRVEECRTLGEDELARIPAHMRRAQECVGGFVDYELSVSVDGGAAAVDTLAPSGVRRDRPVYVLRDIPVEPGSHRVEVRFRALLPPGVELPDAPVVLAWSGAMDLEPGQVGLVTLDASGRSLVRGEGP